jgi:hypothetical protein
VHVARFRVNEWSRFSLENDADLDQTSRVYVDDDRGPMRCSGDRCPALVGDVDVITSCAIELAMTPIIGTKALQSLRA